VSAPHKRNTTIIRPWPDIQAPGDASAGDTQCPCDPGATFPQARRARAATATDLLTQIYSLQATLPAVDGHGPAVSRVSLQADLANAEARTSRLLAHNRTRP
jgi:hypothetical protein